MLHIEDLRIDEDVLPLLDYTHAPGAKSALRALLHDVPPTVELVVEKQAVFRGFWAHWAVLADFSYQKTHLYEVHAFLEEVATGRLSLETNRLKATAQSFFSETAHAQTRSRCIQVVLFWQRLHQHYFQRLAPEAFPPPFRAHLRAIAHFLERFGLEEYAHAIHHDAFAVAHLVRFTRQLQAVTVAELATLWGAFYAFEAHWSAAKGLRARGWAFPQFVAAGLQLDDFYHPALAQPVTNSLVLGGEETVVVLTGPNMSGKSTLLKAVGLCVYLAHAGLGVPAARCTTPFFTAILVAINLRDSLKDGFSHFMVELHQLKGVLQAAAGGGRVFAIFDELFRGTNGADALDLTTATVRGLAGFPASCFFVSTHLLHLPAHLPPVPALCAFQIECVVREGGPVFTFRLQPGWSRLMIGRMLFEQLGIPALLPATTP